MGSISLFYALVFLNVVLSLCRYVKWNLMMNNIFLTRKGADTQSHMLKVG